jgi:hypothetical protein
MIVMLHAATGALAGAAASSRGRALALGPLVHLAGDAVPHEDIRSRALETAAGVATVGLLASRRGVDAATVGAAAACAPDLEHILPLPRPGGRPLFPSHRWAWPSHGHGLPVWAQLALAVAALAALLRAR